jgi:hypothetical protein
MTRKPSDSASFHVIGLQAAVHVLGHLAIGFNAASLCLFLLPEAERISTASAWLVLNLAWILLERKPALDRRPTARQIASALLSGSSLAAILWCATDTPIRWLPFILGLSLRWLFFVSEKSEIRDLDLRKISLPSHSTLIRLSITWMIGGIIPLLILLGTPPRTPLIFSCALTLLSQWALSCEQIKCQHRDGFIRR